jgi:hypothetical protein
VDAAELEFLTRGLSVEADASAAPRFRVAAARLVEDGLDNAARRAAAADAARLLISLALGGATDELAALLVPDPDVTANTWTVACYEIGGLTPVAVREFDDPVEAIVTLSACPDEAHVAAELVASNEDGIRWTAVWRTDDHVSFQVPSDETAEALEEDGELVGPLARWRALLSEWSSSEPEALARAAHPSWTGHPQLALVDLSTPADDGDVPDDPTGARSIIRPANGTAAASRLQDVERRLEGIESALNDLNVTLQTFAIEVDRRDDDSAAVIERAIDVRFQALSKVVRNSLNELGAQLLGETARSTRDIEAALREETGTVLMGIRAGLSPLTKEVIERISVIESRALASEREASNAFDMRR